jgi:hypothetical protein
VRWISLPDAMDHRSIADSGGADVGGDLAWCNAAGELVDAFGGMLAHDHKKAGFA